MAELSLANNDADWLILLKFEFIGLHPGINGQWHQNSSALVLFSESTPQLLHYCGVAYY